MASALCLRLPTMTCGQRRSTRLSAEAYGAWPSATRFLSDLQELRESLRAFARSFLPSRAFQQLAQTSPPQQKRQTRYRLTRRHSRGNGLQRDPATKLPSAQPEIALPSQAIDRCLSSHREERRESVRALQDRRCS